MTDLHAPAEPVGHAATETHEYLRAAYRRARQAGATRHRDIAEQLGISEGALIAVHGGLHAGTPHSTPGLRARRLRAEWPRLLASLEAAGEVMALTRNASCVHEKVGVYRGASASGPPGRETGLVLGADIDLRVFYSRWAHGFAVDEPGTQGVQRSLQFFDAAGQAVHKVFARPATDLQAWATLAQHFLADDQTPGMTPEIGPEPATEPATERPDAAIDQASLRQAWAAMRDTHDFFGLLKRHGVTRTQALRLAEARFVQAVDSSSAHQALAAAATAGTPVMVFVGNPGMIQIHTGPVHKVAVMGPWLNVLDPSFNLHLREDHIASAWVVRKPTSDGLVTSLELFDAQGDTIAMLFGERKPGRTELCAWRAIIDSLLDERAGLELA